MPRNGTGTYNRTDGIRSGSDVFAQQLAASQAPTAALMDAEAQDMAEALTASLTKDGQATPTANQPMGGFRHTNVDEADARTDYARASQVQDNGFAYGGSTTGSLNVYAVTLTPAPTVYTAGMLVWCQANHTNTAASTLAIGALAAKAIRSWKDSSIALRAGAIQSGMFMWLLYDGTQFRLLNPRESDAAQYARYEPETATADGADSGSARIQGFAGTTAQNRGAYGIFYGNEGSAPGVADISAGSVSGAFASIDAPASNGVIKLQTNAAERWRVEADGDLVRQASGGDIDLALGGGVRYKAAYGLSAAGADQAGATQLSAKINHVNSGSGGVKLEDLDVGEVCWVTNSTGGAINVYPPVNGNLIVPAGLSTNDPLSVAIRKTYQFAKVDTTVWAVVGI